MRNDREDWTQRLYGRLPEIYRLRDIEQGRLRAGDDDVQALAFAPLHGLVRTIGASVALVRQDLDELWDDFFIETCDDWAVPYLGALLGTNLAPNAVGQGNRLDVRSTVSWRRSKGTPEMLRALAAATTGWTVGFAEFLEHLAWNQNLNHTRMTRTLTAPVRDATVLTELGRAGDRCAHLADIRAFRDLDRARRVAPGRDAAAWGTPGRYLPRNVGFFAGRLTAFRLSGVTPAPRGLRSGSFDPLSRDVPLFAAETAAPIAAAAFAGDPGAYFGPELDVCVRRAGVALARPRAAAASVPAAETDFTFGAPEPAVRLHATEGLRLLDPRVRREPEQHFIVRAIWETSAGDRELGALRTAPPPAGVSAYRRGDTLDRAGRLVIRVETGAPAGGDWDDLSRSEPGRFPANTLAVRDDRLPRAAVESGRPSTVGRYENALLVSLPELFLWPGRPLELLVAEDGSTYRVEPGTPRARGALARASAGQVWPPADLSRTSSTPAVPAAGVHRRHGLRVADASRFDGFDGAQIEVHLAQAAPLLLGGLVTAQRPLTVADRRRFDLLGETLTDWPAGRFLPSLDAVRDRLGPGSPGLLVLSVAPLDPALLAAGPQIVPQCELVLLDRAGDGLMLYLPELALTEARPQAWLAVADDGSTHRLPGEPVGLATTRRLPADAVLARSAAGQVQPLEGAYPLRHRIVVGGPPRAGEFGVDVERGRFCLSAGDPLAALSPGARELLVDYAEGFSGPVGARPYERARDVPVSRIVASSGDAVAAVPFFRIHRTLAAALDAATDHDVIEIADSATYAERLTLDLSQGRPLGQLHAISVRAGTGLRLERPCVAAGAGDSVLIRGVQGLDASAAADLENHAALEGLLIGGPVRLDDGDVASIELNACTLVAGSDGAPLVAEGDDPDRRLRLELSRCTLGALRAGRSIHRLLVADSIVDQRVDVALGGLAGRAAMHVQLERTTVLGQVRCTTLVASESLLTAHTDVVDRQAGCVRFCRFEPGSLLPRRYRCVPAAEDGGDPARAVFVSLRPANPGYGGLDAAASPRVARASESGDHVGAFASTAPQVRLDNLRRKLDEFLPVGLSALVIAES